MLFSVVPRRMPSPFARPLTPSPCVQYAPSAIMKKADKPARRISRREFARSGAFAAASAACLPATLLPNAAAQSSAPTPASTAALSADSQQEVDVKVAAILRKYGQLLTNEEKLDIRRLVTEGQKPLEILRSFSLDNSDQPGNVLKLYPDAPISTARSLKPPPKSAKP